jgi:hypothetical protein
VKSLPNLNISHLFDLEYPHLIFWGFPQLLNLDSLFWLNAKTRLWFQSLLC